jgi:hypothetical protein
MDDFVINVRQVGQYPQKPIGAQDLLLIQQGGIGGTYACCTQDQLLGQVFERVNVGILPAPDNQGIASTYLITPLGQRQGFNWYVDEDGIQRYLQNGVAGYWSFTGTNLVWATAPSGEKDDAIDTTMWTPIFGIGTGTSGGTMTLSQLTITGTPSAPTDAATVGYVTAHTVASFNSRTGAVTLTLADITGVGGAPLASPAFTGVPTAPTATTADSSSTIATTAFVHAAVATGVAGGVTSFNSRTGAVLLNLTDVTGVGGAPIANPAFTGTPTAPTPAPGNNSTAIATTAFVTAGFLSSASIAGLAPLASPAFTGVPTAPTPTPGTNTGQLATTAFVTAAIVASTTGVSSFNTRTGAVVLNSTDITTAGGAALASPTFTGTPNAPTAAPGTATTQIATTAFVTAAIGAAGGVTTFMGRSGAVTLTTADITAAGGAVLAGPAFTGVPTAPTAAPGTSTTQLATTAFVTLAVAASVLSFNGRSGAVTLTSADISAAGGALLSGPAFTGVPTAPTATAGTNTTQLATTAFVQGYVPNVVPSNKVVSTPADFSTSITLASTDNGCVKTCSSATPVTVTCPGTLPFEFYCTIIQAGAGQITFAPSGAGTLNNRQAFTHSAGQYAICALIVTSNTGGTNAAFILAGDCA